MKDALASLVTANSQNNLSRRICSRSILKLSCAQTTARLHQSAQFCGRAVLLICLAIAVGNDLLAQSESPRLKDYVSCQFTLRDEAKWKEQNADFIATRDAAVRALQDTPSTKEVKEALKSVPRAQNRTDIQAALDKIPDASVKTSVSRAMEKSQAPPEIKPPDDLLCSRSLLSWEEASDIFGRRIARTYLVVQVVVRNLNQDNDYLIQDVILAAPEAKFDSGRDKLLARGVSSVGQSLNPRNQIMSALDTLAATSGAIALVGGSNPSTAFQDLQSANNVLGAFIPPLKRWFPDLTIDQLNRLNDLAFSASTTYKMIVPRGGSVPLVTFIPQKVLQKPVKKWTRDDFLTMDRSTFVLVAGMHISKAPATPIINSLSANGGRPNDSVTITGSNFGASQGILKFGSATPSPTSWSPTSIVVSVPNMVAAGRADVVVSASGVDSAAVPFVVCAAAAASPCITGVSPNPAVVGSPITIAGKGFGTSSGTVSFGNGNAATTNWADTAITMNLPTGLTAPVSVVVTTAGGVSSPPFPIATK